MADLGFLIAPAIAFFVAAGSPGPATLAVAGVSMASGRRAGLALAIGLSVGLAAWGVLVAVGLGAFVLGSPPALLALRIIGGLYLLWLAWKTARSAMRVEADADAEPLMARRLVLRGLLLNLTNPKAALAWAAVIALGLPGDATAAHLIAISAMCSLLGLIIYIAYALGFAAPPVRAAYVKLRRSIDGALAMLFGYAGLRLLTSRGETP